jgi:hypothetical protein
LFLEFLVRVRIFKVLTQIDFVLAFPAIHGFNITNRLVVDVAIVYPASSFAFWALEAIEINAIDC